MHAGFRGKGGTPRDAGRSVLRRGRSWTVVGALSLASWTSFTYAPAQAAPGGHGTGALAAGEPALGGTGPEADYVRSVHARLHKVWHDQYLPTMSALDRAAAEDKDAPERPAPAARREVTLGLEIRWDGSVAGATIERSSGDAAFDQAAVGVVRTAAPLPVAAHNLLSDDGYLHLRWTLARDERACAAGAEFFRQDDPLDVALPRLLAAHRFDESVRRVAAAPAEEREAATDRLARLWLAMPVPSAQADVRAAAALAHLGDRRQEPRLRAGLALPQTALTAAEALEALGTDVCAAVAPLLKGPTAGAAQAAMSVLDLRAQREPEAIPCAAVVTEAASNPAINAALRARLVGWVARDRGPAWKARYAGFMADKAPAVRATALLASVKRNGGRPEMYRLVEFLKDPAVEVRGAASAGLVRAAGDQALDQLYLLTREKDVRAYEGVAAELATLSTPASAEFLGKLLHHGGVAELPAVRALAARRDPAARALVEPVLAAARLPDARPELRALVEPPRPADPSSGLTAEQQQYHALLLGRHVREAATWLLGNLATTEPTAAVPLLCDWLDRNRGNGAAAAVPGPGARMASTVSTP